MQKNDAKKTIKKLPDIVGDVVEHLPLQYFQFLIVVPVAGPIWESSET